MCRYKQDKVLITYQISYVAVSWAAELALAGCLSNEWPKWQKAGGVQPADRAGGAPAVICIHCANEFVKLNTKKNYTHVMRQYIYL